MKVLKNIVYIIIGLIAIFFIVALFLPEDYNLDREIVIAKPVDIVYAQVVNYENRVKWSPWIAMDPEAKNTFEGTMGEVGAKWSWVRNGVGMETREKSAAGQLKSPNLNREN